MSKIPSARAPKSPLSNATQHDAETALRLRGKLRLLRLAGYTTALAVTVALGAAWWTRHDAAVAAPPAKQASALQTTEVSPSRDAANAAHDTKAEPVAELSPAPLAAIAPSIDGVMPAPFTGTAQVVAPPEARMNPGEMRQAGRAKVQLALAAHRQKPPALKPMPAPASVTQPLALAPLPTEPPPAIREAMQPAGAQTDCCPGALPPLPEPAKNEEPGNVERRQLSVAAQQVGKGDWKSAHALYREIAATTQDELVRVALRRNLEVTEKQLDIQNEPDPSRREWLELDLARVHQDLGHSFAAQRMWRDLEKRALHPDVRAQSARLRLDPPKPTRPVTLPTVQSQPEIAP